MKSHAFCFALLSLTAIVATAPAQAQNGSLTRSFVSSAGVDTNPCTVTQPCATFAHAYTAIGANGIIAALDPGKYGPITITTGVTINGNGWSAITAPAQGDGITINAGSGNVALIGLEIDGADAAYNGILLNSAASLTVTNCILQNFFSNSTTTGNGILMQPSSGSFDFTITNTTVANNSSNAGIYYNPPFGTPNANGVIDHVIANGNLDGIYIFTGAVSGGSVVVTISNTVVSANASGSGIIANNFGVSSTIKLSVDNVSASGNSYGVYAIGTPNVLLGRSVITGNGEGIHNATSPNTVYTYGDNRINLNPDGDINGALNPGFSQQ